MNHGLKPIRADHRDRSYPATFGATTTFPDELNLDAGFGFPDQNADGLPEGCTGYAQSELCQDEDKLRYQPKYTYDKTRLMEGSYPDPAPCDIRTSLKSLIVYGALAENETNDSEAGFHRRGAYYNVVDSPNLDAFDDVRSAIWTNNRTVSVGTPWFPDWENITSAILLFPTSPIRIYHNWKICGWKQIGGKPYLIGKSWQGPRYGDNGYHYVSRELFNYLMTLPGTGAFTVRIANRDDYQTIRLAMYDQILSYLRIWITSHILPLLWKQQ